MGIEKFYIEKGSVESTSPESIRASSSVMVVLLWKLSPTND